MLSTSGAVIQLQGWPPGVPYPEPGMIVSAAGRYLGAGQIEVEEAEIYPLHGMDMLLGVSAVSAWFAVMLLYVRRMYLAAGLRRG